MSKSFPFKIHVSVWKFATSFNVTLSFSEFVCDHKNDTEKSFKSSIKSNILYSGKRKGKWIWDWILGYKYLKFINKLGLSLRNASSQNEGS